MRLALSEIPDEVIDAELVQIRDMSALVTSLAIVCARGATPVRVLLLGSVLRECYRHPGAMTRVQKAIEACWCTEILEMILGFVGDVDEWSEHDSHFFWTFARMVAGKISENDRAAIENALVVAKNEFARRILRIWRAQTLGPKVGLLSRDL
jgi:hypothetical protein